MTNEQNPFESPKNLTPSTELPRGAHPGAGVAAWILVSVLALIAVVPGFFVSCLGALFLADALGQSGKTDAVNFILGGAVLGAGLAALTVFMIGWRIIAAKKRQRISKEEMAYGEMTEGDIVGGEIE